MKEMNIYDRLQKEKEKLNELISNALNNGIPIIQDNAVMVQNHKVDILIGIEQKKIVRYGIRQQDNIEAR